VRPDMKVAMTQAVTKPIRMTVTTGAKKRLFMLAMAIVATLTMEMARRMRLPVAEWRRGERVGEGG